MSADQFTKLFRYLTKRFNDIDAKFEAHDMRFDNIDQKFDKIDEQFIKTENQFDKLTAYMLKRFDRVDSKLEEKADKPDVQRALGLLDSLTKSQETYDQERLVMAHQLGRLDGWTHELAGKIGHKLST